MKKFMMAAAVVAAAGTAAMAQDAVLFDNGPFITGSVTQSGVAAPAGWQWSEVSNDAGNTTVANTTAGFGCGSSSMQFTLADDFTVPQGQTWNVTSMRFWGYQTGATSNPFTGVVVRIFNDNPMTNPGATVVFGDLTTNRLASTSAANIYRTFNTIVPPTCGGTPTAAGFTRPVFILDANVNVSLPAGTYWVNWGYTGTLTSGPWCPTVTIQGQRLSSPANNSMQATVAGGTGWVVATDAGQGCGPTPVNVDHPFQVIGTATGGCYADCNGDGALTLADFGCFQSKYALGCP